MMAFESRQPGGLGTRFAAAAFAALLGSCGGGTGTEADSGPNKTTLRVEVGDADGDTLTYQWRVTGGTVQNLNARETVWTLPDGPGLHFAYAMVSDGRGGYAEQQYAVSSDALRTAAPTRPPLSHTPPAMTDFDGSAGRLRFRAPDTLAFVPPAGGAAAARTVYLPDMSVQVVRQSTGEVVFSGLSDLSGEIALPKLRNTEAYSVRCAPSADAPMTECLTFTAGTQANVRTMSPALTGAHNLRLFGHVAFADGGVCGNANEFFGVQSAASVQLQQPDGTPLTPAQRVNRFGDYAIAASVPVQGALKLLVRCEGYSRTLDVPADAGGYVATRPVELSHAIANSRPVIVKMVASGPDGNVRGRMIVPETGAVSNVLPGSLRFLTFKGYDTKLSACMYYRSLGATRDCDAQGNMIEPITLDDWRRLNHFAPNNNGNVEVAATYINKMDLNLVRRMQATRNGPNSIAFVVCNHPGPDGQTQEEVDEVMTLAFQLEREVACVAMEWSTTAGVNNGQPYTKFFTFGPDGRLLPSVNLDGRGEKYMPGACVACHGGSQYNGRFPEKGNPSGYLGARFLPFDTGNYYFASALPESAQHQQLFELNKLVREIETDTSPIGKLIRGWYHEDTTNVLDKEYVPDVWRNADAQPATAGAARFYRDVVGASCRTCHGSMGSQFDWDSNLLTPVRAEAHVCGGKADLAINATMPNALISRDRVEQRVAADPALAALMRTFLGCDTPRPDPVYPAR